MRADILFEQLTAIFQGEIGLELRAQLRPGAVQVIRQHQLPAILGLLKTRRLTRLRHASLDRQAGCSALARLLRCSKRRSSALRQPSTEAPPCSQRTSLTP